MARELNVYLNSDLIGCLVQEDTGQLSFSYNPKWLSQSKAVAISNSLPLSNKVFTQNECRGFFAGILPEETQRRMVARNLGVSANNDFALLEKIGGECAGAITFLKPKQKRPKNSHEYQTLSSVKFTNVLHGLHQHPLMAGQRRIRLSLAGAQDKIAIKVKGNKILIPVDDAPTTHIVKPAMPHVSGIVQNEALCLKLARLLNLNSVKSEVKKINDVDYLLVERYDRAFDKKGNISRLHQEDFCQALGIPPEMKYQNEGGPSLKQCFELIRKVCVSPVLDLRSLLDAVLFNFLIGNCDAHGKNFSLIYEQDKIALAPFYDLVCTSFYTQFSDKMAMKIGGKYKPREIQIRHFEQMAEQAGLAKRLVLQRLQEMAEELIEIISAQELSHEVERGVAEWITKNCKKIVTRW